MACVAPTSTSPNTRNTPGLSSWKPGRTMIVAPTIPTAMAIQRLARDFSRRIAIASRVATTGRMKVIAVMSAIGSMVTA